MYPDNADVPTDQILWGHMPLSTFLYHCFVRFTLLKTPKTKTVKFENRVDPDEVAHHEPPHLDLHC